MMRDEGRRKPNQGKSLLEAQLYSKKVAKLQEKVEVGISNLNLNIKKRGKHIEKCQTQRTRRNEKPFIQKKRPVSAKPRPRHSDTLHISTSLSSLSQPSSRPQMCISTSLSIARQRKRHADAECLQFRNRIKLLQNEQQRALHQVTQAKKQALDLVEKRQFVQQSQERNRPSSCNPRARVNQNLGQNETYQILSGTNANQPPQFPMVVDETGSPTSHPQGERCSRPIPRRPASATVRMNSDSQSIYTSRNALAKAARKQVMDRVTKQKRMSARRIKLERRKIREDREKERQKELETARLHRQNVRREIEEQREKRQRRERKKREAFKKARLERLRVAERRHKTSEETAVALAQLEAEYTSKLEASQQLQMESYQLFQQLLGTGDVEQIKLVVQQLNKRERKLRMLVRKSKNANLSTDGYRNKERYLVHSVKKPLK